MQNIGGRLSQRYGQEIRLKVNGNQMELQKGLQGAAKYVCVLRPNTTFAHEVERENQ